MNDYKEPTQQTDIERKRGETTLKQCGWCIHASGRHRFDYCIEGKCQLQKSYSKDVTWDMPCFFLHASKDEIDNIINHHKYAIKESENSITRHKTHIVKLKHLKLKALDRPPLPDDRSAKHFNIGDDIAVYFNAQWYFGKVVNGYRHHNGCVTYDLENYKLEEGFPGCGISVPIVMLRSEYDWFKSNPDSYAVWCQRGYKETYNGDKLTIAPIT